MGVLSLSMIILSLTCLAVLMGLVFAAIFLWPHDKSNRHDGRIDEPNPTDHRHPNEE